MKIYFKTQFHSRNKYAKSLCYIDGALMFECISRWEYLVVEGVWKNTGKTSYHHHHYHHRHHYIYYQYYYYYDYLYSCCCGSNEVARRHKFFINRNIMPPATIVSWHQGSRRWRFFPECLNCFYPKVDSWEIPSLVCTRYYNDSIYYIIVYHILYYNTRCV